jgi:hypothetical protein
MSPADIAGRIRWRYRRSVGTLFRRRPLTIRADVPRISFTFDDFPKSALHTGGAILRTFNVLGTYYASFGLMGKDEPTGRIFMCPTKSFRTFSYPVSVPRPRAKQMAEKHFACCRGGGQTFNTGVTDRNYLRAYFLDKDRSNPSAVRKLIDDTCRAKGWLIFATHDVAKNPTRFGCTPEFFEDVVHYAAQSGARIQTVIEAFEEYTHQSKDD